MKAYDAGDHVHAAQLYVAAWRANPAETAYLYAASRAEQMAGLLDAADQHYRAYLGLPGIPDPLRDKVKIYLREVSDGRADQKAQAAQRAMRAEDLVLSAQLYRAAHELAPARLDLLFKAGAAAQSAGDKAMAEVMLRDYMEHAPADAPDRGEAALRLSRLQVRSEPSPNAPSAPQRTVAPLPQAPADGESHAPAARPAGDLDDQEAPAVGMSMIIPGWIMFGVGTAGAVWYGLEAQSEDDRRTACARQNGGYSQCISSNFNGDTYRNVMYAFSAVAVTGLALAVVGHVRRAASHAKAPRRESGRSVREVPAAPSLLAALAAPSWPQEDKPVATLVPFVTGEGSVGLALGGRF